MKKYDRRLELELKIERLEKQMDMLSSCCDYRGLEELEKEYNSLVIELYRLK